METFSALLALCAGNSPVTDDFPSQRPVTRSFDVLYDLRLNKRLSKQLWGWWFETPSRPLWRHCNVVQSSGECLCPGQVATGKACYGTIFNDVLRLIQICTEMYNTIITIWFTIIDNNFISWCRINASINSSSRQIMRQNTGINYRGKAFIFISSINQQCTTYM